MPATIRSRAPIRSSTGGFDIQNGTLDNGSSPKLTREFILGQGETSLDVKCNAIQHHSRIDTADVWIVPFVIWYTG